MDAIEISMNCWWRSDLLGCQEAIAQRSKSWAYGQQTKRHGPDKLGDGDGAGHGAGMADG